MAVGNSQHSNHFNSFTSGLVLGSSPVPAQVSRSVHRSFSDEDGPVYERQTPTLKRYTEPLIKERLGNPNGDLWRLTSVLDLAREGGVAAGRKMFPWSHEQIEAMWDNIASAWSIGMMVAVDAVDAVGKSPLPWPERFGPWPTHRGRGKRTWLLVGAEKLLALAWSLSEPPTRLQQRCAPEETLIWTGHTLVADAPMRRIRFISGAIDFRHQLPIRLFPDPVPYLRALNQMEVTPIEREWLNRTARRLLDAHVGVYCFPASQLDAAEAMIANFRRIGVLP